MNPYEQIEAAITANNLPLVQQLYPLLRKNHQRDILSVAVRAGHLNLVEWIYEQQVPHADLYSALEAAIETNNYDIAVWLWNQTRFAEELSVDEDMIEHYGEELLSLYGSAYPTDQTLSDASDQVIMEGDDSDLKLSTLKFLAGHDIWPTLSAIVYAIEANEPEISDWLLDNGYVPTNEDLEAAIKSDDTDILDILAEHQIVILIMHIKSQLTTTQLTHLLG